MTKKTLKTEYQPGGTMRNEIIKKAAKYIKEFPGLQSDKHYFLVEKIGLSETEYLEALNMATDGEFIKTALK